VVSPISFQDHILKFINELKSSIGLPPAGKFHIDVNPSQLAFKNQSIKGTLVAGLADVDETLEFARRGLLRLEATVVGLSQFNEAVQKLKNGQVAG
jgi:alcohol dehydrogenase, propanol-preferring